MRSSDDTTASAAAGDGTPGRSPGGREVAEGPTRPAAVHHTFGTRGEATIGARAALE
jgi:hypothetical protein